MAQCFDVKQPVYEDRKENVVIKTKTLRSKKYRRRKLRARRRKLCLKRKSIVRGTLQRMIMGDCQDLMTSSDHSNRIVHESDKDKEWQYQEDAAYWKARAISLEYENKMLYKYIKQMYIQSIQANENQYNLQSEEEYEYVDEMLEYETNEKPRNNSSKLKGECKHVSDSESDSETKPTNEDISKKRNEEMETLYGFASRKILGMETALQLQFEHATNDEKVKYWPVIPFKL